MLEVQSNPTYTRSITLKSSLRLYTQTQTQTILLHSKMATYTRSDKNITCAIQKLLDENIAVRGETESERREKRIIVVKKMFDILCSTPGKTYVHKHEKFKKVLFGKLEEFKADIPELVRKWRREIFESDFKIPEEQEEEQEEQEEEEEEEEEQELEEEYDYYEDEECDNKDCDICFDNWIDRVSYSGVLTRTRLNFLTDVWDIIKDINDSMNDYDFQGYNRELYDVLCSRKGRQILDAFPEFRTEIEGEAYNQALNGAYNWEIWWPNAFGCEINDPRYWVH